VRVTSAPPAEDVPSIAPRLAWPTLLAGVALVGVGLGMMIDADFGVAPADAFFTALSRNSGLTVGVILVMMSVLMVIMAWSLGVKPAIGTLISFIGIAVLVDLTRLIGAMIGAPEWPLAARIAWWTAGLLVFCAGVTGIFSADLGVSPYDLVTQAVSRRTHLSLGISRLIVDAMALLGAILLGGSWGLGTLVILIAVPLTLNLVLPRARAALLRRSELS